MGWAGSASTRAVQRVMPSLMRDGARSFPRTVAEASSIPVSSNCMERLTVGTTTSWFPERFPRLTPPDVLVSWRHRSLWMRTNSFRVRAIGPRLTGSMGTGRPCTRSRVETLISSAPSCDDDSKSHNNPQSNGPPPCEQPSADGERRSRVEEAPSHVNLDENDCVTVLSTGRQS